MISQTLHLDAPAETNRIATTLRGQVFDQLKRRGVVVGISGGIDSSVAAALAVRALFFVKNGDGAADLTPLAHLYKSQVYQLAECLDVPMEIQERPPTTDTYSLEQSQEEFYFAVPHECLDACLFGLNTGMSAADTARESGLADEQVARVYRDIESKRRATRYLHVPPLMVADVSEAS